MSPFAIAEAVKQGGPAHSCQVAYRPDHERRGAARGDETLRRGQDPLSRFTPTGARGLRLNGAFEVDHHAAGFEFKRLPRRVRIEASITLEPAG